MACASRINSAARPRVFLNTGFQDDYGIEPYVLFSDGGHNYQYWVSEFPSVPEVAGRRLVAAGPAGTFLAESVAGCVEVVDPVEIVDVVDVVGVVGLVCFDAR